VVQPDQTQLINQYLTHVDMIAANIYQPDSATFTAQYVAIQQAFPNFVVTVGETGNNNLNPAVKAAVIKTVVDAVIGMKDNDYVAPPGSASLSCATPLGSHPMTPTGSSWEHRRRKRSAPQQGRGTPSSCCRLLSITT